MYDVVLLFGGKNCRGYGRTWVFVAWYLVFMNEKTCICSLQVSYALKQAYYFISKASLPNGLCVLSLDQVKIFQNVTGVLVNDSVTDLVCS
jgi:hypothetical protein